jgi:hypothetical protein
MIRVQLPVDDYEVRIGLCSTVSDRSNYNLTCTAALSVDHDVTSCSDC